MKKERYNKSALQRARRISDEWREKPIYIIEDDRGYYSVSLGSPKDTTRIKRIYLNGIKLKK